MRQSFLTIFKESQAFNRAGKAGNLLVVGSMAKEALNIEGEAAPAWQHRQTRAAILAAARDLLAGDGTLTLGAVADKTGFAPPTIYAYFASRSDLQVSILADDFVTFARSLRDDFPFSEPEVLAEEPQIAEPDPSPVLSLVPRVDTVSEVEQGAVEAPADLQPIDPIAAVEPEPAEEPDQATEPQFELTPALQPATDAVHSEPADDATPAESAPVSDVPAAGGELAELKQAVARLEAHKVDAWLERRLRVFEKTLAGIETRLASSEGASTQAASAVAEGVKTFAQRAEVSEKRQREATDGFAQRIETAERGLRGTVAELRAGLNDVYYRLEALEIVKGMAVAPSPPSLDDQWQAGEVSVPPREENAPAIEQKPLTAAAETYLSAARRAAKTAAELAQIDSTTRFIASARQSWLRTRFILAGCVGVGVVLVTAGLLLRHYMAEPRHIVVPRPVIHAVLPMHRAMVAKAMPVAKPAPVAAAPVSGRSEMETYRLAALASTGNTDAELLFGVRKMDGDGTAQSDAEAAQLFQHAADQDNPIAQYWLGTFYERGRGVTANAVTARHWYETAAKKGNLKAMYNLAVANAQGLGGKRDPAQAAHWFWVAAMQGYGDAQYNLAVLYERGQGVPQSLVNAYKWYAIAAKAGDQDSKARVDALKTQLGAGDLESGERAAAGYKPNAMIPAANLAPDPAQLPGG
jgi:TPR repeat protein/AcrR family transcriptional regulator